MKNKRRIAWVVLLVAFTAFTTILDIERGRAQQNNLSIGASGNNVTYSSGQVTLQGIQQPITGGTITGPFTASLNDCSPADIQAGSANCLYVYATPGSAALQASSIRGNAYPNTVAVVTTNSSGAPLVVSSYSDSPPMGLGESQSPVGFMNQVNIVASPYWGGCPYSASSCATPCTAAAPCINPAFGSIAAITLGANAVPTISAPPTGKWVDFMVTQPASGGPYTLTWPSSGASKMHSPAGTSAQGLSPSGGQALVISTGASTSSGAHCYFYSGYGWGCSQTFVGMPQ